MKKKKIQLQDLFNYLSRGLSDSVKKEILPVTGRGNQSASRDYVQANCLLAEYRKVHPEIEYLTDVQSAKDLWKDLHPATQYRLRSYTPMLAVQFSALKPDEQKKLFEQSNYVFTSKENGIRAWIIICNGDVHVYSRNYSEVDCSLLEYWNNIDQSVHNFDKGFFAIDVEIKFEPGADISADLEELGLSTTSPLEAMTALLHTYPEAAVNIQRKYKAKYGTDLVVFRLIAPLYFNGVDYTKLTIGDGKKVYKECGSFARSIGLNVKPIKHCAGNRVEKENFVNTLINEGQEGVVVHNLLSPYVTSDNRYKDGFIKIKRTVGSGASMGIDDTIDGWISGFKVGSNGTANEGLISAFQISSYISYQGVLKEHIIAVVPNVSREVQIQATFNDASGLYPQQVTLSDGSVKTVSLNPKFDRVVCEVGGQAFSERSLRLEHPRLIRFRFDKAPEMCILSSEFIQANKSSNLYKTGE